MVILNTCQQKLINTLIGYKNNNNLIRARERNDKWTVLPVSIFVADLLSFIIRIYLSYDLAHSFCITNEIANDKCCLLGQIDLIILSVYIQDEEEKASNNVSRYFHDVARLFEW